MHTVLDEFFLPTPALATIANVRRSKIWKKGHDEVKSLHSQEKSDLISNFIREHPHGIIPAETWIDRRDFICEDIILPSLRELEERTGGQYIAWRVYPYATEHDNSSYSLRWHFDVHVQQDYPYMMHFFCPSGGGHGGTEIIDAESSELIANSTGYISSPINTRVEHLAALGAEEAARSRTTYTAGEGNGLIFWPSRVLHKGVSPQTGNTRLALHLSFLPVSNNSTIDERVLSSYEIATEQISSNDSYIPFYFDESGARSNTTRIVVWDGSIKNEADRDLLVRSIFITPPAEAVGIPAKSQSINAFLQELPPSEDIQTYITSVNTESGRYQSFPRQHTFWPNPTHHKYPASIRDSLPYVRSNKIVTLHTALGSAGSCFAVEISEHFQKNNYNYLITEKPDATNSGVQVDGYTPGASKYVRFSANYGIHFNSLSLEQLAQRAYNTRRFKKIILPYRDFYVDPYRELVYFLSPEAYIEDYDRHTHALRELFDRVNVFIFTMGLNECWRFRDDGTALSRNPWSNSIYQLVRHDVLTVDQHVNAIEGFYLLVKKHNPEFKLILSLSPIAFLATGIANRKHVIEANCHSKAVQRVAAEILATRHTDIYYFPSYEYVTECLSDPWKPDGRHLKEDAVAKVMDLFEEMYVSL